MFFSGLAALALPALGVQGADCTLVDFEGIGDVLPVGTIPGSVEISFGPSWFALIDSDAGGSGHFANEPSPDAVAFFGTPLPDPIDFSIPVRSVELWYSASRLSVPFIVTAWDGLGGSGQVVVELTGTTVGTASDGAACSGDPDGDHCLWDVVTLMASSNAIRSLTISGAQSVDLAIDDLLVCWDPEVTSFCFGLGCPCGNDDDSAGCANSTQSGAGLLAAGSTSVLADDLVLSAAGAPTNAIGIFFMGTATTPVTLGDGLRCVGAPIFRYLPPRTAQAGVLTLGPGIVQHSRGFGSSGEILAGSTWSFQAWYRDGFGSPCGARFNLSSAVQVDFVP
jgi:hypothetical protein